MESLVEVADEGGRGKKGCEDGGWERVAGKPPVPRVEMKGLGKGSKKKKLN